MIEAFRCICGKLIEIKDASPEYFTVMGDINLGDDCTILGVGIAGDDSEDTAPIRICVQCFLAQCQNSVKDAQFPEYGEKGGG